MRHAWVLCLALGLAAPPALGAMTPGAWVDQEAPVGMYYSDPFSGALRTAVGTFAPGQETGQEFVPSSPVHVGVSVWVGETRGQEVFLGLLLREDSVTGPIVEGTAVQRRCVVPPDYAVGPFTWGSYIEFIFDEPVGLTPGARYVWQIASDDPVSVARARYDGARLDPYPQGCAVLEGVVVSDHSDLAFQTWVVPEPGSAVLLTITTLTLLQFQRRQ